MTSNIERFDHPDGLDKVVQLHGLGGNFVEPSALEAMKNHQITHIFIGGGRSLPDMIDPLALQGFPFFEEIYNLENVHVFKIVYP